MTFCGLIKFKFHFILRYKMSRGSIKARKGTPFEKNVMYSLIEGGFSTKRLDDNKSGIDLISEKISKEINGSFIIECKHHASQFTYQKLQELFDKTEKEKAKYKQYEYHETIIVFKSNNRPVEVYKKDKSRMLFGDFFNCKFKTRPTGHKFT